MEAQAYAMYANCCCGYHQAAQYSQHAAQYSQHGYGRRQEVDSHNQNYGRHPTYQEQRAPRPLNRHGPIQRQDRRPRSPAWRPRERSKSPTRRPQSSNQRQRSPARRPPSPIPIQKQNQRSRSPVRRPRSPTPDLNKKKVRRSIPRQRSSSPDLKSVVININGDTEPGELSD
jgi:hypothetical protein